MNIEFDRVPDSCTLSEDARAPRLAELAGLLSSSLRDVARQRTDRLRLTLDESSRPEVDRLVAAESRCCAFFGFTVTSQPGTVTVDIAVPAAHTAVLDELAARASAVLS